MNRESLISGTSILGVVAGLLVLLFGEAMHFDSLVLLGGVIALVAVGLLTAYVANLPHPHED